MRTRLRLGLYNIQELSTEKLTMVDAQGRGTHPQLLAAAAIIARHQPDVLVINEIDHDLSTSDPYLNLQRFRTAYLIPAVRQVGQMEASGGDRRQRLGGGADIWPHLFTAPCNTGIPSGFDFNGDGAVATPENLGTHEYALDCWGYGRYPGQYCMAVFSRYPIDSKAARTFQHFLWKNLPGNHMPVEAYPVGASERFPLSSKSHWVVPVVTPAGPLHLWMCHPTPRGYGDDGGRNMARNHDELAFWKVYLDGGHGLVDDQGRAGGHPSAVPAVLIGDLNAEPDAGRGTVLGATMDLLLKHPQLQDTARWLTGSGALEGGMPGPPEYLEQRTMRHPRGTARLDYILPTPQVRVEGGGVFWPTHTADAEGARLAHEGSDHRFCYLDVALDGQEPAATQPAVRGAKARQQMR